MSVTKHHIAELVENRREALARAENARARGFISLADGFDRVVEDWDLLLARHGEPSAD